MHFDSPTVLALIPPVILAMALAYAWAARRRRRALERFADAALAPRLVRGGSPGRRLARALLTVSAVALLLVALARPQFGAVERPLARRGVEVVVALDCSRSMAARDLQPSRLARAKVTIRDLVSRLEGDNISILAFAGIPVVQCPMTGDYDMALNLLDAIDTDTVPVPGTAITDAIDKAVESYRTAGKGYRVLVLLTDGEDHEGQPLEAARRAAEAGVRIYAVGLGTTEGAPVPLADGKFREYHGVKVNSRLDYDTLDAVAQATGGRAMPAQPAGDREARVVADAVAALKDAELRASHTIVRREAFWMFLALAALLLVAELSISEGIVARSAGRQSGWLSRSFVLGAAAVAFLAWPGEAGAESARRLNNRGVEAYEGGRYAEAAERFQEAAVEKPDDMRLIYNRGAARVRIGDVETGAKDLAKAQESRDSQVARRARFAQGVLAYKEAEALASQGQAQDALARAADAMARNRSILREAPGDSDARVNYEMASRLHKRIEEMLKQQQNQQQQNPEQDKQDQQQQNRQQDKQNQDEQKKQQDEQQQNRQQDKQNQDEQNKQDQQNKQDRQDRQDQQKQDRGSDETAEQKRREREKQRAEERQDEEQGQDGQSQAAEGGEEEVSPEDRRDATVSMLNLLDDNDVEAVKRMLRRRYGHLPKPDKDW